MRGVHYTTLRDKVGQSLATGRCFFPDTPVSSTNTTYPHTITEILLKVTLNTITLTYTHSSFCHLLTYIIYSVVIIIPHYVRPNIKQFYSKGRKACKCATRYNWGCVTHYNLLFNHSKCSQQITETLKGYTIH